MTAPLLKVYVHHNPVTPRLSGTFQEQFFLFYDADSCTEIELSRNVSIAKGTKVFTKAETNSLVKDSRFAKQGQYSDRLWNLEPRPMEPELERLKCITVRESLFVDFVPLASCWHTVKPKTIILTPYQRK